MKPSWLFFRGESALSYASTHKLNILSEIYKHIQMNIKKIPNRKQIFKKQMAFHVYLSLKNTQNRKTK